MDSYPSFSVDRSNSTAMSISHVLFANDTTAFCGDDREQMVNLRCVLGSKKGRA